MGHQVCCFGSRRTNLVRARYKKWKPTIFLISSRPGLVSEMGESTESSVKERMVEHNIAVVYSARCIEVTEVICCLIDTGERGRNCFNKWFYSSI